MHRLTMGFMKLNFRPAITSVWMIWKMFFRGITFALLKETLKSWELRLLGWSCWIFLANKKSYLINSSNPSMNSTSNSENKSKSTKLSPKPFRISKRKSNSSQNNSNKLKHLFNSIKPKLSTVFNNFLKPSTILNNSLKLSTFLKNCSKQPRSKSRSAHSIQ